MAETERRPTSPSPDERIAQWAERDTVIGLEAEAEQLRAQLAERDTTIATLHERTDQLANRVAQLTIENDALRHQVAGAQQPTLTHRVYRKARSVAGRVVPH